MARASFRRAGNPLDLHLRGAPWVHMYIKMYGIDTLLYVSYTRLKKNLARQRGRQCFQRKIKILLPKEGLMDVYYGILIYIHTSDI